MPPEPPSRHLARLTAWAQAAGRASTPADFAARLDGRQVAAELFEQFRASQEFGRSLSERIEPYHDPDSPGELDLIDAGREAVVFFDQTLQQVIKLFAPPNEGRFGWVFECGHNGRWGIRGGSLVEALLRFGWFEACFVSGLELDSIGCAGDFLTLRQPFYVGRRPSEDELESWMTVNDWELWSPPTDQATVATCTWRRGDYAATDVLSRNAILSESDGRIHAIDFIVAKL